MNRHPLLLPYVAMGCLCFFWGTTYAGIRMALESFPPQVLVGTRFFISGSLLLAGARLANLPFPPLRTWIYPAGFGLMTLGIGNSCLTYAELLIPSSLAALFVTVSPFWMTGLEALQPGGERLRPATVAGMLIGLGGTALLVGQGWTSGLGGQVLKGFLVIQFGCFSWSLSSVAQRRYTRHIHAVVNGAIQQLAAGVGFLLISGILPWRPVNWNVRGVSALIYLVIFGSIIGYTSFVYTLKTLPVAIVALHVYINPVVAAVLGWAIFREPFGFREMGAMLVIFLGVYVVSRYGTRSPSPPSRQGPPSPDQIAAG
ncbi:MAG: EamA family transporter [Bryobacteraceae bacterium]|nr:EamA family transporter [Bryobacteraceae bacterium]